MHNCADTDVQTVAVRARRLQQCDDLQSQIGPISAALGEHDATLDAAAADNARLAARAASALSFSAAELAAEMASLEEAAEPEEGRGAEGSVKVSARVPVQGRAGTGGGEDGRGARATPKSGVLGVPANLQAPVPAAGPPVDAPDLRLQGASSGCGQVRS